MLKRSRGNPDPWCTPQKKDRRVDLSLPININWPWPWSKEVNQYKTVLPFPNSLSQWLMVGKEQQFNTRKQCFNM